MEVKVEQQVGPRRHRRKSSKKKKKKRAKPKEPLTLSASIIPPLSESPQFAKGPTTRLPASVKSGPPVEEEVSSEFEIPETEDESERDTGGSPSNFASFNNSSQDLYEVINLGALVQKNKPLEDSQSGRPRAASAEGNAEPPQEYVVKGKRTGAYYYVITGSEEAKDDGESDEDGETDHQSEDTVAPLNCTGYEEKLHENLGEPEPKKVYFPSPEPRKQAEGVFEETSLNSPGVIRYEVVPSLNLKPDEKRSEGSPSFTTFPVQQPQRSPRRAAQKKREAEAFQWNAHFQQIVEEGDNDKLFTLGIRLNISSYFFNNNELMLPFYIQHKTLSMRR